MKPCASRLPHRLRPLPCPTSLRCDPLSSPTTSTNSHTSRVTSSSSLHIAYPNHRGLIPLSSSDMDKTSISLLLFHLVSVKDVPAIIPAFSSPFSQESFLNYFVLHTNLHHALGHNRYHRGLKSQHIYCI